ncbi:MAG: molybdopterin-dependent oxidoreductase [Aggregatilineales bacterium]
MISRRHFLIGLGALLAGCRPSGPDVPTAYVPGSSRTSSPITPVSTAFAHPSAQPTAVLPAGVPIIETERLYLHSYRPTPDLSKWSLTIDGLVDRPLTLSMDDIRTLPALTFMYTLECIGNITGGGLIGNLNWTGVALADLLSRAGVQTEATYVHFKAADEYTTSVKLEWLTQPGVMLVYAVNGEPLPPEHGYPLRLMIPGLYGQKQPKWITQITLMDHDVFGYWEGPAYEWSNIAAVKTNSQIVTPYRKAKFTDPIRVEGLAYAGKRAITKVEVSVEGNTRSAVWHEVTLIKPPSPLAWTWWVYDWSPPTPGDYTLAVRATDETGFTQSASGRGMMEGVYPDGTDAIQEIPVSIS